MIVPSLFSLFVATAIQGAASAADDGRAAIPFSIKVTEEKLETLPDYMGPKNPVDMDFPYCPVMIDGEYWIIYKNGYSGPVLRYKGTNIENAVRQPDGAARFPLPRLISWVAYGTTPRRNGCTPPCTVNRTAMPA